MSDAERADRRSVVAKCSLALLVGLFVLAYWAWNASPRIVEAMRIRKPFHEIPNLTFWELYKYTYLAWSGPAIIVSIFIWMHFVDPPKGYKPMNAKFIWWLGVLMFSLFVPTFLGLICVIALWALLSPGTNDALAKAIQHKLETAADE